MTNLESILKSRDITLPTKFCLIKALVLPVSKTVSHVKTTCLYLHVKTISTCQNGISRHMYGCESWIIKKVERRRIDAFELRCWRRLLRVPWTARRSNQSISPQYSLEGLMLKVKLQYFCHLMGRTDSLEKTLMLGKIEGRRRRG